MSVLALLVLTGCGGGSSAAQRWHDSKASPSNGVPIPAPAPSDPTSPSTSPSAGPSRSATPSSGSPTTDVLSRLPKFGPRPPAVHIAAQAGPNAPIYKRLPIDQPVAFLTIDDGWIQQPQDVNLMRAAHIPFTMFLIAPVAGKNPGFFQQLVSAGGVIEDHTVTHTDLKGKPYAFQRHEVCEARTSLEHTFGTTLHLFRPPYGDYDLTTLRAVHDCGLDSAFFWSETVNNGTVFYQTAEHRIHPGDIILMHFRPAFVNDVIAALTAIHNAGLVPALLEDYLT
jgi:peptidoglycan/xylan/chitin deacetylase (PgdA/CDA1 family)